MALVARMEMLTWFLSDCSEGSKEIYRAVIFTPILKFMSSSDVSHCRARLRQKWSIQTTGESRLPFHYSPMIAVVLVDSQVFPLHFYRCI